MSSSTISIPIDVSSSATTRYNITIGNDIFSQIPELVDLKSYSQIAIVTDTNVAKHWLDPLKLACGRDVIEVIIDAGEEEKHSQTLEQVWASFLNHGMDRKSLVLNLGGGVIGDLGGFAAASFMRGIDFVQLPTTLLSQVDASVGGKVGINFGGMKNILGSFSQPIAVIADVHTLSTLPERELRAGFAEVLKHGFVRDVAYLAASKSIASSTWTPEELISVVEGSCRIKAAVVEADEREGGLRKILNFGHTAGHALESLSHKGGSGWSGRSLLHGEAVSLGMVVESKISELARLISAEEFAQIYQALAASGLPVKLSCDVDLDAVIAAMQHDKKNVSGQLRWTLLKGLGEATFDAVVDKPLIEKAFYSILPD